VDEELAKVGQRMYELASSMPGFISYGDFMAADGENVAVIEFESLETLAAWREHPDHILAQQRGRSEFFTEYRIQVCTLVRGYDFEFGK
jgi:heme-degrading monooxygenase HmoA